MYILYIWTLSSKIQLSYYFILYFKIYKAFSLTRAIIMKINNALKYTFVCKQSDKY